MPAQAGAPDAAATAALVVEGGAEVGEPVDIAGQEGAPEVAGGGVVGLVAGAEEGPHSEAGPDARVGRWGRGGSAREPRGDPESHREVYETPDTAAGRRSQQECTRTRMLLKPAEAACQQ